MVIFSRNLKLAWLNETARLWRAGLPVSACRERLTAYLSTEITSPTNLRKTREILMRLWFYDGAAANLRGEAATLLETCPNAAAIHWSLLLVTYPVFAELSRIIGRLFELGEVVTARQIRQKLFDALGERTTLFYSAEKILSTLRDFGILTARKPGQYTLTRSVVDDERITALLIRAALAVEGGSYRRLNELENLNVLYPFRLRVTATMLDEKIFTVTSMGGERVVLLK